MDKPMGLKIQEFQKEVTESISKSGIPIYILKYLIKDLYTEIDNMTNDLLQKEINDYYQDQNNIEEKPLENKKGGE